MNWYKEYPAGIESWKFLFPQSVFKMLLFNEKVINISLTKQKKNWLTCEVKVLQNFDASMLITKYYCLSQDVVTSDANHNFFDRVLLVLFSWWSPASTAVLFIWCSVTSLLPNSSPEQELLHAAVTSWFTSEVTSFYDRLSKHFLIIILY